MLNKALLVHLSFPRPASLSKGHHQPTAPLLLCDNRIKLRWSFDHPQSPAASDCSLPSQNQVLRDIVPHILIELATPQFKKSWRRLMLQTSNPVVMFSEVLHLRKWVWKCWDLYHRVGIPFGVWSSHAIHLVCQPVPYSSTALAGEGLNSIVCYCELNQRSTRVFPWTNYLSCLGERNVKWKNNPLDGCVGKVEYETGPI